MTCEDKTNTNSTSPSILKHYTNDSIIQLKEPFSRFKELHVVNFILIL